MKTKRTVYASLRNRKERSVIFRTIESSPIVYLSFAPLWWEGSWGDAQKNLKVRTPGSPSRLENWTCHRVTWPLEQKDTGIII